MPARDDRYVPFISKAGEKEEVPKLGSVQEELRKIWEVLHSLSGRNGQIALLNDISIEGGLSAEEALSTDSSITLSDFLEWEERPFIAGEKEPGLSSDGTARIYFDRVDDKLKVSEDGGAYQDLVQTIPTLPTESCRIYNSAAITCTTAVSKTLTFNSERFDNGGMHSTTVDPSRITIPTTGIYLLGATIEFATNNTGVRAVSFFLDGTTFIDSNVVGAFAAVPVRLSVTTLYSLTAGQYVEVQAFQNSGGDLDVNATSDFSPLFWAIRVH